jgi:uncharacterized protein (TIGR00730 family)
MKKICVFCGSRSGNDSAYERSAVQLGEMLVAQGITLVYGGAKSGLMGTLADTMLAGGGEVIGVMPQLLVDQEILHRGLSQLEVVDSMQARKQRMFELADGFVVLPGGTGTLDELSEIMCLVQIGAQHEPIGLLDANGFFAPWLAMFDHMVEQGFLQLAARQLLLHDTEPGGLLAKMRWVG